ncbi:MAG TPA: carbon storage regulator CsrA [Symbiobacteriaceae bacterium]
MLVLTRRINESILIGEDIEIRILQVRGAGDQAVVRLGITAPRDVTVLRKEVYDEVVAANRAAARPPAAIPPGLTAAVKPGRASEGEVSD